MPVTSALAFGYFSRVVWRLLLAVAFLADRPQVLWRILAALGMTANVIGPPLGSNWINDAAVQVARHSDVPEMVGPLVRIEADAASLHAVSVSRHASTLVVF